MNIYLQEFKSGLKTSILWALVVSSITGLMLSFYPLIKNDAETFMGMMENFPPALRAAFGIVTDSFTSTLGFYGFALTYAHLFAAIQAMNLGVGILSKEERERTADFLLTKPVSRTKILVSKLMYSLTAFLITLTTFWVITFSLISIFSEGDFDIAKFSLINISLLFLQLIFFTIGLVISVFSRKIKSVLSVSLGLVFGFFAISAFAVTSTDDKLRFFSPFQYFKTEYIVKNGNYEIPFAVLGAVIVVVGIALTFVMYKRRDIHSV